MKPVTIVGGGLAGLALGVALRRQDVPVRVVEAAGYPRHRVCGEFISGRGQSVLESLGLLPALAARGTREATAARFFTGDRALPERPLPRPALCIARYDLDACLASEFQNLGGDLRTRVRWKGDELAEGLALANGRRRVLREGRWRWLGLKVHVRGARLEAPLEMHRVAGGYVGLCELADGSVNVCGLFRRGAHDPTGAAVVKALLGGKPGSTLHSRMQGAAWEEETFCSVAGLSLRASLPRDAACRIGDAFAMIAPATGNGMSMAFEAAELAAPLLTGYSRGTLSWAETREGIANGCASRFRRRLRWGGVLHGLLLSPVAGAGLAVRLFGSARLWEALYRRIR